MTSPLPASTDTYLVREACPCCGRSPADLEPVIASTPRAEDLPADAHGKFLSGYDKSRVFFSYYDCPECTLRFCRTFYTPEQLERLYGHQHENMGEVPLPARRAAQERYARFLLKHTTGRRSFLEIGADIGLFAKYCAENWSFDWFWLYEPNREVTAELEASVGNRPREVLLGMIPGDEVPEASVSAMALIHVLDHLLEPVAFLEQLASKLERGGVVMTVTHNCQSLLARILGKRFPPYTLQHPELYSPNSITDVFARAGLDVIEIEPAINYFPLGHLVRGGSAALGLPDLSFGLQGPILPIGLGNMATLARKR